MNTRLFDPTEANPQAAVSSSKLPTLPPQVPQLTMIVTPKNKPQTPKIVIKPFKVQPKLPDSYEDEAWNKLYAAIRAIQLAQPVAHTQEDLYHACEDLCTHQMAENLYRRLTQACETHIKEVIETQSKVQTDATTFIVMMNRLWDDHCKQMLDIQSIFLVLDRSYALQSANVKPIWELGSSLFRQHLELFPEVLRRTINGVLICFESERRGEAVDRELLRSVVRMISSLRLYNEHLLPRFLLDTTQFYTQESNRLIVEIDVPEYLLHVEKRICEEVSRCEYYLEPSTRSVLIKSVQGQLLVDHASEVLTKGFESMMEQQQLQALSRLYGLMMNVNCLDKLLDALKAFVKKIGFSIVQDEEKDKTQITELIEFRQRYDSILERCFENNKDFTSSVKETWELVVNMRQTRTAELLAKFADSKLRSGEKGDNNDEELDVVLDRIMTIFRHLQAKDVFEAFYKKDLAKRLIMQRYASIDAENSMISKLKTECGNIYTAKLEGMFKDIELSQDIMQSFNDNKLRSQIDKEIAIDVKILATNCWPSYPPTTIDLPQELARFQDIFTQFYVEKHKGRCLKWQHHLGSCLLQADFTSPTGIKRKELQVSLFQTVCLMSFNDATQLTLQQLRQRTCIEAEELNRTLLSLSCGKVRVLDKSHPGKQIEATTVFSVANDAMAAHKLVRMKISTIQVPETPEEAQRTHQGVFQDRQFQIDAAIVRIMKTRKTLIHNQLVTQLFEQLKFPVKTQDLKKRIENLIEREYMERDKSDKNVYHYLA
eukprot:c4406_g1_i2.p1 GENE.c4406_g1_i2~~c4406_g1_i2.p1  ORF type:complete len:770 (-),score=170.75 c4406_g1_i2:36-2345(-)